MRVLISNWLILFSVPPFYLRSMEKSETPERRTRLKYIDALEVGGSLDKAFSHGLLSGTEALTRVVVFFVRLLSTIGVANLALEVIVVLRFILPHTIPERPLRISVNVQGPPAWRTCRSGTARQWL